MIKIGVVYFTFGKDEFLLEQSIFSVQKLNERDKDLDISIFVVDDANCPLNKKPDGVEYMQTSCPRNSNLVGKTWIREEARVLEEIYDRGFDYVIKVDSDTWINSFDYLKGQDGQQLYYTSAKQGHCYGATMVFNKLTFACIKHFLKKNNFFYKIHKFVLVDDNFFMKSMLLSKRNIVYLGEKGVDFLNWWSDEMEYERFDRASSIDFKEMTSAFVGHDQDVYRAKALQRMKNYRRYKYEGGDSVN